MTKNKLHNPEDEARVICRTPTPGKKPTTISAWKFETTRKAILNSLPAEGEGVLFTQLAGLVEKQLSAGEIQQLGAIGWYTTAVKLELEVRGEIRRLKGVTPQRLLRC